MKPKRTDKSPITYPKSISAANRQFCRKLIVTVGKQIEDVIETTDKSNLIIACSAGIDSTVLTHAVEQWYKISGVLYPLTVCYVNHNLRDEASLQFEEDHVRSITPAFGQYVKLSILPGKLPGLQERARQMRYDILSSIDKDAIILTGHTLSDVAETKLFQFVTGRVVSGIARHTRWKCPQFFSGYTNVFRPILDFTREDIERYAEVFNLRWCEDKSNASDDYTRNKIRHHLIPFIKQNINPAFEHIV